MARADIINRLYSTKKDILKFNFDALQAPPLFSMITPTEVMDFEAIISDPRYVTKLKDRLKLIDQILERRKFMRITQGTNRAVYKFLEDQSIVLKTAISKPGIKDSYFEYYNQAYIKPFVAKCFETVPSGIVGLFERVSDITSIEQFKSIAPDVFALLNDNIIGKYIMADVGTKFFRNYGIRLGFGPVLLDYPMLYEVDGKKLYCNSVDPFTKTVCEGPIDYDDGFNFLYCKKCGRQFLASELAKKIESKDVIINSIGRSLKMKISFVRGDKIEETVDLKTISSDTYVNKTRYDNKKKKEKREYDKRDTTLIITDTANNEQYKSIKNSILGESFIKYPKDNFAAENVVEQKPIEPLSTTPISDSKSKQELQSQASYTEKSVKRELNAYMNEVNSTYNNSEEEYDDEEPDPNEYLIEEGDIERIKRYIGCCNNNFYSIISNVISDLETKSIPLDFYIDLAKSEFRKIKMAIFDSIIDDNFDKQEETTNEEEDIDPKKMVQEIGAKAVQKHQSVAETIEEPSTDSNRIIDDKDLDPIFHIDEINSTSNSNNKPPKQKEERDFNHMSNY